MNEAPTPGATAPVSIPTPTNEPGMARDPAMRGTASSGISGSVTIKDGVATYSHEEPSLKPPTHSLAPPLDKGVLASARSQFSNAPRSGADLAKPGTIVTVTDQHGNQFDTDVQSAVNSGFLVKNADGSYSDAAVNPDVARAEQQQQQQQEAEQQANASRVPDLPPEAHSLAQEFTSKIGNVELTAGLRQLYDQGTLSGETLSRVAGQLGVEPSEVQARVETIREAYAKQALDLMGVNGPAITEWARTQEPKLLAAAMKDHVENEFAKGYAKLSQAWTASIPFHSPHLLMNTKNAQEIEPQQGNDGRITVKLPNGQRVDWSTYVRLGGSLRLV